MKKKLLVLIPIATLLLASCSKSTEESSTTPKLEETAEAIVYEKHMYIGTTSGLSASQDLGVTWTNYATPDLGHNIVYNVRVYNNKIYIATHGGLTITDRNFTSFSTITNAEGLASDTIHDVCKSDTHTYVATTSGLSISSDNESTWVTKTSADGMRDNNISSLKCDNDHVYIGSSSGLSISTDASASNFTTIGQAGTEDIELLPNGRVLIAHTGGLSSTDPDDFNDYTAYSATPNINHNEVKDIYVEGDKVHISMSDTTDGGYSSSDDNGSNWTLVNNNFPNKGCRGVAANGNLVMIATVFKTGYSTDGGMSFTFVGSVDGIAGDSGKITYIHAWPQI